MTELRDRRRREVKEGEEAKGRVRKTSRREEER